MKRKFSAASQQDAGWWIGWRQAIPGMNSPGKTRAAPPENLEPAWAGALELKCAEALLPAQRVCEKAAVLL